MGIDKIPDGQNNEQVGVKASAGEPINEYAERVAQAARKSDVLVKFNDIEFIIPKGESNPVDIVTEWKRKSSEKHEQYKNSPEGKAAAEASTKRMEANQRMVDELISQLDTLDFSDFEKVLDWCEAFRGPSDSGTKKDKQMIMNKFAEHGYLPNVNTGPEFKADDKENYARYLIGQALSGIGYIGAIHQVFHKFYDEWKAKFLK